MATSSYALRVKTPVGIYTIYELDSSSTIKALKETIEKLTKIEPEKMKILHNYPPQPLKYASDNLTLHEVGILSGEILIIRIDDTLQAQTVPESNEPTSSHTPKKRKQEHPVVEKPMKELKDRDEVGNGDAGTLSGIMMRHDVPSNNSCLFSSIYFIMNDGKLDLSQSDKLRKIIAEAVLRDPIKYDAAILGRENHDYCEWILNRSNWGGAIELAILSDHFKIEICAIDIMSCKMLRFGENNNYGRRGIVVYDGIHYDPLYLQHEEHMETIFQTSDTKVWDLALELAKEARSSKQFTDVVNFKLKCNVCGQRLVGEKDACAHATATGHVSFGELL